MYPNGGSAMGRKDIRQRETKKVKKGAKQTAPPMLAPTLIGEPEVVRKKKPARDEDQP